MYFPTCTYTHNAQKCEINMFISLLWGLSMHWLKTWCVFSSSGLGEDNSIAQKLHVFFPIVMAFGPHFFSCYHYTTNQMWWRITIVHGYLSKFYINKYKNLYPWLWHVLKVTTILLIQPHPTPKLLFKIYFYSKMLLFLKKTL
jgi:hypothetical protein